MPNDCNAGGKSVRVELIHKAVPLFPISGASNPEIKPQVEAASSGCADTNSCTAPKGNRAFGKASAIGPKPISTPPLHEGLNPSSRRISDCNSAMIPAFFPSSMTFNFTLFSKLQKLIYLDIN